MTPHRIFSTTYSFLSATRYHISGGLVLIVMAVLAMAVANSSLGPAYQAFWQQPVSLQIGSFNLFSHEGHPMTLLQFINDALMAIFFFSVGLEIKREVLVGELSSPRKALLPIIAACGGMLMPVTIYYLFTRGTPEAGGMAIPMATDIAFSLGVLSLCGKRVPLSLKVFLTAFAVVDDIGGILVIALFYSSAFHLDYLLLSAVTVLFMCIGNFCGVRRRWFYLWLTLVLWYLFMQSGVHSTIAGVIAAFTVPATPGNHISKYINRIRLNISNFPGERSGSTILSKEQINMLKSIESASDHAISPLQSLEDEFHSVVNYVIMPLFAFANAGVAIVGADGSLDAGLVTLAVMTGLVVGKFLGIFLFTLLSVKLRISPMPSGMTTGNLLGVSLLGGIGFTVSLFIANLSFSNAALLAQAKLGVVSGTVVAALLGIVVLKISLRRR